MPRSYNDHSAKYFSPNISNIFIKCVSVSALLIRDENQKHERQSNVVQLEFRSLI